MLETIQANLYLIFQSLIRFNSNHFFSRNNQHDDSVSQFRPKFVRNTESFGLGGDRYV
jgi:hypothetical protein